jgi:23S rRNA U2552 (ribose-2'-O)-methylase RlmE/FtsJ
MSKEKEIELPSIFFSELPKLEFNILNTDNYISTSNVIKQPEISLGFNYFIFDVKDKLSNIKYVKSIKNNRHLKRINSEYEITLNDKNAKISIQNETINFFNLEYPLASRAFYKLWELFIYFDNLVSLENKEFKTLSLAEAPGGFMQAIDLYRNTYVKNKNVKDYYCTITLNSKKLKINECVKNMINKKDIYDELETVSSNMKNDNSKTDGDLTKISTLELAKQKYKDTKFDLITADGGFRTQNENYQEQLSYSLIFGEIIFAITFQKKGGNFVLKIFETYTKISIKMILILQLFYDSVHLTKPLMSRTSNSEKYIIASNFKYNDDDNDYKNKYNIILKIFRNFSSKINEEKYITDMLNDIIISNDILSFFRLINVGLTNKQLENLLNYNNFILNGNYNNDEYNEYIKKQQMGTQLWIKTFLIDKSKLKTQNEKLKTHLSKISELFLSKINDY